MAYILFRVQHFPRHQNRGRIFCIRFSLILLSFIFAQCTQNFRKETPNAQGEKVRTNSDTSVNIKTATFLPPVVVDTDTCPKPFVSKILQPEGSSGINKKFKAPDIKHLPLSRLISKDSTIINQESQGIGFFTTYTTDDGLALDGIASSFCDKSGYLWFGTYGGGVSRYDGKSFTNFTTAQGLASNMVICIAEDKEGNIWFGTPGGLSRYDGRSFVSLTTDHGLLNNSISSLVVDKKGLLWIGTRDGISRYDGKSFTNLTTDQGLPDNNILSLAEDRIGNMWIGTDSGGVSRYDGKSFTNFSTREGLADRTVTSIAEDKTGCIWFGTNKGISRFDGKSFSKYSTSDGLVANTIVKIIEDKSGYLWFATDAGISRYDGKTFASFTSSQGIASNTVTSITEDDEGNIWFCTQGGGLSRYNGSSFTRFTEAQGLVNNIVWSILEDKKGKLWFGTNNGASCYDGKSFTNYTLAQGLTNYTVFSIVEDRQGNLWFTNGGGVSRFDGKYFTRFTFDQGQSGSIVWSSAKDKKGDLWFGTSGGGVFRFDGKSFTNFTSRLGLVSDEVLCIAADSTGNLWFGTEGRGVSRFDGRYFTNFTTDQGLANNTVLNITADRNGNLWLGTEGGISMITTSEQKKIRPGSNTLNQIFFKNLTTREGLPSNEVMHIMQCRDGTIYAGTFLGICQIIQSLDEKFKIGSTFNSANGYPVKDLNSGNTLYEDSKGIIWIGTGSDRTALVRFDPRALHINLNPIKVVLQGCKINNENICWNNLKINKSSPGEDSLAMLNEEYCTFGKELSDTELNSMRNKYAKLQFGSIDRFFPVPQDLILPHSHNNVTFEFNALQFSRHSLVRYQYILEGYDKEWSPVTSQTSASFGNIFEGIYSFKVKACNPDGVWSEPLVYRFRVLPPWYRTWWMYVLYLVIFISVIFLLYRWRVSKLEREKKILEEKVKLRTAQLQEANTEIKAQRDLVTIQKEHIEEIHREVTDSIHYAKRLQTSVLPNLELLKESFSDLFILFKPKDIVSGDFYWYAKVNNHILVTVADCTGHGVPGAFMSMLGMSLITEIVIKEALTQPNIILDQLRHEIIIALGQTGESGEQKDGMDISLCSINTSTFEMQWSGANIPCLIIRDGELIELKADKMPIAIYEKMDEFALQTMKLQQNDIIYLAGDGFHDQFGGPDNKKFMTKRFKELLLNISRKPMSEQKEILDRTIEEWKENGNPKHPQTDDITVLGLKI